MQSCIICLEEGANLKQLNHCGVYYVHKKCHSKWNSKNNTCIVCREPLVNEHTIAVQDEQLQEAQQVQRANEILRAQEIQRAHEIQRYSYYRIINTLQFKVIYTIIVITMTTAFIFYIM
jgi:hypothetical protein